MFLLFALPQVNKDGKHILTQTVSNSSLEDDSVISILQPNSMLVDESLLKTEKMEEHELQFQIAVKDEGLSESKLVIGSIVNDNMLKTEKLEVDELQYGPPVNDENLSEPEIAISTTVNEILLETEKKEEHELQHETSVREASAESSNEMHRFEDLCKQTNSQAELEPKKTSVCKKVGSRRI